MQDQKISKSADKNKKRKFDRISALPLNTNYDNQIIKKIKVEENKMNRLAAFIDKNPSIKIFKISSNGKSTVKSYVEKIKNQISLEPQNEIIIHSQDKTLTKAISTLECLKREIKNLNNKIEIFSTTENIVKRSNMIISLNAST